MTSIALCLATVTLFVRTVFRSVELSGGFSGPLANSEVQFMVLDGVMVLIASTCLTVMHPGIGFGKAGWAAAKFRFRKNKVGVEGQAVDVETPAGAKKFGGNIYEQRRETTEVK
jgi:hypothetical protein